MITSVPGSRTRLALASFFVLLVSLTSASDVAGHHRPSALYTGTHSAGGAVEINTSVDNQFVTRYRFEDVPCNDGSGASLTSVISYSAGGEPITGHATSVDDPSTHMFSASFGAPAAATGSWLNRTSGPDTCVTETVMWSATTTAAVPGPCVDGDDNDGDGRIDFGVDPGCTDLADADESDPPPPAPPDTTAPASALSGNRTQKAGRSVSVTVACPTEACTATANGAVNVPAVRASKRIKLRTATAQIAAGAKATLRLRLSAKGLKAVKKALKKGAKVSAKITVRTADQAGNGSSKTRVVKLRR
jgi:hypothetical protein